jgi:sortase A
VTLLDEAPAVSVPPDEVDEPGRATSTPASEPASELVDRDEVPLGYIWRDRRRLVALVLLLIAVLVVATVVVVYLIGPLIHDRDQRSMILTERTAIANAVHDNQGLYRPKLPDQPPVPGAVLGILAIPTIGLEQAVVEGVGPSETVSGPGHVPGTAGLGQPGNSAVVGRRAGYGGPFKQLNQLRPGTKIIVATTEGQSIYVVHSARQVTITTPVTQASVTTTIAAGPASGVTASTIPAPSKSGTALSVSSEPTVTTTSLYGPTVHNQLTLVTSASAAPWNSSQAFVVVARLHGLPYTAEPQQSRSPSQNGNSGNSEALAWLLLDLLVLVALVLVSAFFYRRTSLRSAYLLTTAPLLVFTILAAEATSRLLPAWL